MGAPIDAHVSVAIVGCSGRSLAVLLASLVWLVADAGCGRINFDTPGGGTEALGCPSFAIFCEDFEAGDYAEWPLVETRTSATLSVSTVRPHTGTYSLESRKVPSGSPAIADIVRPIGTHNSGNLAIREWIYSEDPIVHYDLFIDLSDLNNNNYVAVGGDTDATWAISEYRDGAPETIDQSSGVPTSMGRWICVELVYTFANPPTVQVSIDATTVLSVNGITPITTFDNLRVGATRGSPDGFHVFVDDVVVATQPIGCN